MNDDDVTLVTGAGSGIGRAVARAVIQAGGCVAAFDRDERALRAAQAEHAGGFVPFVVDVADEQAVGAAVAEVESALGPTGALVHAAGVLAPGALLAPTTRLAELRTALGVHVEGLWCVVRAVAPYMVGRARGSIVTVSSNAGSTPRVGMGAYCASKAAETMLTRCFGLELAAHGIRCNVVSPGSTDTPMLRDMLGARSAEELVRGDLERHRLGIPLGRIAGPDDVAEVVLFLLSERARHVTLQDLRVDGGATL